MSTKFQAPRGTHDVLPGEHTWWHVVRTMEEQAAQYGWRRIQTPGFEDTGLFARTAGAGKLLAGANGPRWPYSDEFTAGIERELVKNMRIGVMYYHRTNRDQVGTRNTAVPSSAYTPFTINVPFTFAPIRSH